MIAGAPRNLHGWRDFVTGECLGVDGGSAQDADAVCFTWSIELRRNLEKHLHVGQRTTIVTS